MGESNTVVSAYTMYRHLQQYCSHPSIYALIMYHAFIQIKTHKKPPVVQVIIFDQIYRICHELIVEIKVY